MTQANNQASGDDRRSNPELRTMFVEAYDIILPFFDQANNWAGHTHEHLAFRALHERFPDLSGQQVLVIVTAAKRVLGTTGVPAP
jgi:hypothetical protein